MVPLFNVHTYTKVQYDPSITKQNSTMEFVFFSPCQPCPASHNILSHFDCPAMPQRDTCHLLGRKPSPLHRRPPDTTFLGLPATHNKQGTPLWCNCCHLLDLCVSPSMVGNPAASNGEGGDRSWQRNLMSVFLLASL